MTRTGRPGPPAGRDFPPTPTGALAGVGIDVVDVARFRAILDRTPRLADRLFTDAERVLPPRSLAARFAAKEALAKALGGPAGLRWHDCEIRRDTSRQPFFHLAGTVLAAVTDRGITQIALSLTHDAGIASAIVVARAGGEEHP